MGADTPQCSSDTVSYPPDTGGLGVSLLETAIAVTDFFKGVLTGKSPGSVASYSQPGGSDTGAGRTRKSVLRFIDGQTTDAINSRQFQGQFLDTGRLGDKGCRSQFQAVFFVRF